MINIDPIIFIELRDYLYVSFGFIAFLLSFIAGRLTSPR